MNSRRRSKRRSRASPRLSGKVSRFRRIFGRFSSHRCHRILWTLSTASGQSRLCGSFSPTFIFMVRWLVDKNKLCNKSFANLQLSAQSRTFTCCLLTETSWFCSHSMPLYWQLTSSSLSPGSWCLFGSSSCRRSRRGSTLWPSRWERFWCATLDWHRLSLWYEFCYEFTTFKTNSSIKCSLLQVLLIAIIVAMFINDTSQFFMIEDVEDNCRQFWWRNLLMIQNLFPKDEICMTWSWYVAADFQLFIAASILLALSVK